MTKQMNRPEPGFFKVRERRRGPWLAASLSAAQRRPDRRPVLWAEINGKEAPVERVWFYGRPIDEDEYKWLKALTAIRHRK